MKFLLKLATGPDAAADPEFAPAKPSARPSVALPLPIEPFDDYSIYVPAAPGDRYGTHVRIKLYAPGPRVRAEPGELVHTDADGVIVVVRTEHVPASQVPVRRAAGVDRN